ncbi:hypothetical protein D3C86_2070550 [compost metagenome]
MLVPVAVIRISFSSGLAAMVSASIRILLLMATVAPFRRSMTWSGVVCANNCNSLKQARNGLRSRSPRSREGWSRKTARREFVINCTFCALN